MLQANLLPPCSGEDAGTGFLRSFGTQVPECTALHLRRSSVYTHPRDNIVTRCAPAASTVQVLLLTPTCHESWCP
jgi:hypothetical protein